jgi:flagellar hook-length control protein FliK
MSGLTSPAASPVALPAKVASPSVLAPGVPSLAAFIDLMIGKLTPSVSRSLPNKGEGQDDAATGNSLPDDDKKIDPALAWLFGAMPLETPSLATIAVPMMAKVAPTVILTETPAPDVVLPEAVQLPDPEPGHTAASKPPVFSLPRIPAPVAPPLTISPPPIAVALPALFALAMTPDRGARDEDTPSSLTPTAAALLPSTDTATSIVPTGDAQRQTLDLGRQDWPQKMIDHIEALRDNANANDTSIRLKPEVLGRVDVSLRTHSDGAISVRFTAEQPTTRTLIADAAPQLAATAEARGIRLSGTSVDLSGQGDHRPRADVERQQNISNRLAASGDDDNSAVDDGRVA